MRMKHNQSFNYVRNNMILTTLRRAAVRKSGNQRPINSIQIMHKGYYGISTINIFNGFNKTILPEDHNENFLIIFSKELTFFNMNSIYLDYEVSKIVSYFKEQKTYNTKKKLETFRYDD